MKRSEALELIKKAVEHSDKKPESIANLALAYLEAHGMLPPGIPNYYDSSAIEINEWEPEDGE